MGMIRGGALVIVSVLFICALVVTALFWTISSSLEYDIVEDELIEVVRAAALEQTGFESGVNSNILNMQLNCKNDSEYVYADESFGETFTIPCEVVANGSESVIEYNLRTLVEESYYQEYECEGWILGCVEELDSPFILVSDYSCDYFHGKFYFALMISLVLLGAMFFLAEGKSSFFISSGFLILLSALPFVKLDWLFSFLDDSFLEMFTIFFSQAPSVFWKVFIIGILFLIIGVVMKMMSVGFKVSEFFNRGKKVAVAKSAVVETKTAVAKK